MTTTTTIRLPEDLKARMASAELRTDFDAEANARFARIVETGKTILWADVRRYLEERFDACWPLASA